MDDLKVYDDDMLSVRNTANRIIQFSYGEDGIDPSRGVHGSPFNIDVIVDEALGTEGATLDARDSYEPTTERIDADDLEHGEPAESDGGDV
jgi:DNA-directed RNA polymerase subunit A'